MADKNTNPTPLNPKDTSDSSSKRYTSGSEKGADMRSRLESERKKRQRATDSATGIFARFQENLSPEDQEHQDAIDVALKSEEEGMSFMERLSNKETIEEKRQRISQKIKEDEEPEKGSFFDIFTKSDKKTEDKNKPKSEPTKEKSKPDTASDTEVKSQSAPSSSPIQSTTDNSRDYASAETSVNQNISSSNTETNYTPQKLEPSQSSTTAQAAPEIGGTDTVSNPDRNRYVDQSAVNSQDSSQGSTTQKVNTTSTQSNIEVQSTQTSTTINVSQNGETKPMRLYDSSRGQVVRSNINNKRKQRLAALAAAALLNLATANEAIANTQDSGNFILQNANAPAQVRSYASDAVKESKPESIGSQFGEDVGSYDEDGNFKGGSVPTDEKGNPIDSKPKTTEPNQQSGQTVSQQPTTEQKKSAPPTYPTQGESGGQSADQAGGQYVDGILQQGTSIPEYESKSQASSQTPKSNPTPQQDPYIPSQSGNTDSAANSNAQGKLNNTAQQKKNKPPLATRLANAVMKTLLMQISLGAVVILLLISALVGALAAATYYLLDSTCGNSGIITAARAAKNIGDVSASTLVGACDTYSSMTGRGCPASGTVAATGKLECIGNEVNTPGESIFMNGPGGTVPVKKATIKEILSAGKTAGVSEFTIKFTIAVHPIESIADGFKAKNPYGCLGIAQFCKGGSYETAIRGTGTTSDQDFLDSPVKQMKAIENFLNTKRAEKQNALICVKLHFVGKSEQYQLFYYWLTADCPGTRDANGFANSDYAGIADKNFAQMSCNEFKAKLGSNTTNNSPWYGDILSLFNGVPANAIANKPAPVIEQSDRPINEEERAKLTELFKSGKLNYELSPLSAYLADLSNPSQPLHSNTGKTLIALAEKFPGITVNALGNNTHSNSGGSHNKPVILAIDIGSLSTPYVDIEKQESKEKVQEFINFMDNTKVVKAYGVYPSQIPEISTKTEVFPDGQGHIHMSLLSTAGFNGAASNSSSLADCTFTESDLNDRQDGQDITKRLNKKSLTDTQWKELQLIYGKKLVDSQFLELSDAATKSSETKQLKMFNSQEATDRMYKIALELGYKYRNVVNEAELDVIGEKGMVKEAKLALKDFMAAANKDGYKGELVSSYRSPQEQKLLFEGKFQSACVAAIGAQCTAEGIASGKHDDILRARLSKSSLPYLSKHHTGLAADINQVGVIELENISNTELFKYIQDDNYFNLKRWGFVPSYPEGGKDMGPFPEKWEIVYVGKKKMQNLAPASPLISEFKRFSTTLDVLVPNEEKLRDAIFNPIYEGKVQPNVVKILNQLAGSGKFSKIGVWSLYRDEGECTSGNNHKCGLALDIQWVYRDGRQFTHEQAASGKDPAATKAFEILADSLKETGLVYQIISAGDIYNTLRIKEGFDAKQGENKQTEAPKKIRMTTTPNGQTPTDRHEDHFHIDVIK
jgi:LAS superfamily LD-carboxypeptidase LdcB